MRNKTKLLFLKRVINEENADNIQPVIDAIERDREVSQNLALLTLLALSVFLGFIVGVSV